MTPYEALHGHRYVLLGIDADNKLPVMAASDNLIKWETVEHFKSLSGFKDIDVINIEGTYYLIGNGAFFSTDDFIEFSKVSDMNLKSPHLFSDVNGNYHISYINDSGTVMLADFDPVKNTISNAEQPVDIYQDDLTTVNITNPTFAVIDGVYFLACDGNYVMTAGKLHGQYRKVSTNFTPAPEFFNAKNSDISGYVTNPEIFVDGDNIKLLASQPQGNQMVIRSATREDIFNWSTSQQLHCGVPILNGSIIVNDDVSAQVDVEDDGAPKFDSRIYIKGLHTAQKVPMTCFIKTSMEAQYEDNETNELQFTAYNDGSPSFNYIANESTIYFNGDLFIIKNVEEDDTGVGLYTVTALQYVNSEISRVMQRQVKNGTLTYTIQDVLNFFLSDTTANPFGFTYNVYGEFSKQQIDNLGNMTGKDMISKIIETWPGTIVRPQGKRLDVFSAEASKRRYGRRIVYLYNSSDMKLIEDSTVITNQIRCIGATKDDSSQGTETVSGDMSQSITLSTIVTGEDNTAKFQADAKKYLGVPYVWGGHNKANPWAGMDCSGFVSQVYHDFGVEVPAYTVSMEADFHEISRDEVKAGDVGFWGPHGHTDHIVLFLDHNTMIYEPQPGESCKTATVGSYHPDWYARNDAIQAKINTKRTETVQDLHLSYDDSGSSTPTSGDTTQQYYFQPFTITDERSKELWGLHPAADLQDDRFKDPQAMAKYARTQLVTDPKVTIEIVMHTNEMPIPGETRHLTIPHRHSILGEPELKDMPTQDSYSTEVTAVGYTWYPFNPAQGTDITFNNAPATILHSQTTDPQLQRIEQLANAALDRMPQVFYTNQDPTMTADVKNGAIWIKPLNNSGSEVIDNGGSNNGSDDTKQSSTNSGKA